MTGRGKPATVAYTHTAGIDLETWRRSRTAWRRRRRRRSVLFWNLGVKRDYEKRRG